MLLGVSPSVAAAAIFICAVAFFVDVFTSASINRAALWGILFLAMCLFSAVMLGGIDSIYQASFMSWIANEGRVFLYYWPALFVLQAFPAVSADIVLRKIFRGATLFMFAIMAMKTVN